MVADDIDDRRRGAPGVVQIGEAVGEPRPQMEQRRRRLFLHAAITVGHSGDGAFEEAENRAQTHVAVERRDEMHFRRSRVGEADLYPGGDQGCDQTVGAVHSGYLP